MEQFWVVLNSSSQEFSTAEQVLTKSNKIQQMLLLFQIILFHCGRWFLPECELGMELTGWKDFICKKKSGMRGFPCVTGSGLVMLSFLSVLCLAAQLFLEGLLCNAFPVVGVKENLFMSALVYFPGRGTRCSLPQPVPAQPSALKALRPRVSEQLFLGPGSDPVAQGWAPPPSI